jgi:hypothetical protein
MKRSNYIIGIGASAVLHGLILWTASGRSAAPAATPPPPATPTPVQIASLDPEPASTPAPPPPTPDSSLQPVAPVRAPATVEPEPRPEAPEPPPAAPAPLRDPAPTRTEPTPPERVAALPPTPVPVSRSTAAPPRVESVPPPATEPPPRVRRNLVPAPPRWKDVPVPAAAAAPNPQASRDLPGVTGGTDDIAAGLPPLRVHWTDAGELRAVARTLGMRLAAVDGQRTIVAEIDLSNESNLKSWQGLPSGYSNRVRMLSPSILPSRLGRAQGIAVREIWLFIPQDHDRRMILSQRDALRRSGAQPRDVLAMDGRFVRTIDGTYRLEITGIRRR